MAVAVKQALHGNWLPRITAEILARLGRCPSAAVSPDREVLQRTTFVREKPYLTLVKVEVEVVGSHPADCVRSESKVMEEQKAKLGVLCHGKKKEKKGKKKKKKGVKADGL